MEMDHIFRKVASWTIVSVSAELCGNFGLMESTFISNLSESDTSTKSESIVVRDFKDKHVNNFSSSLERVDWENLDKSDANSAYESFVNKFSQVYNKNIPTKTIQLKSRVQKSCRNLWLTKGLLKSIRTKAKLYKKILKNPSVAVEKTYK